MKNNKTKITKVFIPGLGERKKDYKGRIEWCYPIDWNKPKLAFKDVDVLVAFSLGCILAINHTAKYKVKHLILIDSPIKAKQFKLKTSLKEITLKKHYLGKKDIKDLESYISKLKKYERNDTKNNFDANCLLYRFRYSNTNSSI